MSLQKQISILRKSEEPIMDAIYALSDAYLEIDLLKKHNEEGDAAYRLLMLKYTELEREHKRLTDMLNKKENNA